MTGVDDPADTMRRAAALMREQAEGAKGAPWTPDRRVEYGHPMHRVVGADGEGVALCSTPAETQHVASWHPIVALAVAAWLDFEAVNAPGPGGVYLRGGRTAYALAVACAYLGEVTP